MNLIDEHRERFGVEPICLTLEWNVSSCYARKARPPSSGKVEDERLARRGSRITPTRARSTGASTTPSGCSHLGIAPSVGSVGDA
jgi:putative transposase